MAAASSVWETFAQLGGIFMLLLGVMWFIYAAYEANRRQTWRQLTKVDDWDFQITVFLKLLTYCGFIVGILSIIVGAVALILDAPPSIAYSVKRSDSANIFTCVFLIVLGLFTFLKPLNDLPLSCIAGLAVATILNVVIVGALMYTGITISRTIAIGLIILFIVIFIIVAGIFKLFTAGIMGISKFISWPPLAFIIAIFCIVQGLLLLGFGISII